MFQPYGKVVLVRQEVSKTETAGGVALPESSKAKLPCGRIVATGQLGISREEEIFKEGVKVYWPEYAGIPVEVGDEMLRIVAIEDIFGYEWEEDSQ